MTIRFRHPAAQLLVAFAALILTIAPTRAEKLVAALSDETVFIESNFTGAALTLFGSIEDDRATISRPGGYDLVVIVRGPDEWPVVRRKDRFAGIWLNADSVRFAGVPTYYAVQSNRGLSLIAQKGLLERYNIGLTNLMMQPVDEVAEASRLQFASALIRLNLAKDLFSEDPEGVQLLTERVFSTRIELPSNIRTGPYRIELFLFRGGALLARDSLNFGVRKIGFEALVYDASTDNRIAYGIAAILIAVLLGWLAGLMFRQS